MSAFWLLVAGVGLGGSGASPFDPLRFFELTMTNLAVVELAMNDHRFDNLEMSP